MEGLDTGIAAHGRRGQRGSLLCDAPICIPKPAWLCMSLKPEPSAGHTSVKPEYTGAYTPCLACNAAISSGVKPFDTDGMRSAFMHTDFAKPIEKLQKLCRLPMQVRRAAAHTASSAMAASAISCSASANAEHVERMTFDFLSGSFGNTPQHQQQLRDWIYRYTLSLCILLFNMLTEHCSECY